MMFWKRMPATTPQLASMDTQTAYLTIQYEIATGSNTSDTTNQNHAP